MSQFIAAYDICDHVKRTQVSRILNRHGYRLQRSVYCLDVECREIDDLCLEIGSILEATDDFFLIPIDQTTKRPTLFWRRTPLQYEDVIVL